MRNVVITTSLAAFAAASLVAQAECVKVYQNAVHRIEATADNDALFEHLSKTACSAQNRNLDVGFDSKTKALIDGVPTISEFVGRLRASSNKSFCSAYESYKVVVTDRQRLTIEPVLQAQANFNECVALLSDGKLLVTHVSTPSEVVFSLDLRVAPRDASIRLESLTDSATARGFTCTLAAGSTLVLLTGQTEPRALDANSSIRCVRAPEAKKEWFAYPPAWLILATSRGHYKVHVPADTILGPESRRDAQRAIEAADALIEEQRTALERQQGAQLISRAFYFGDGDTPASGKRFNCSWWRTPDAQWKPRVQQALCKGSVRATFHHHKRHSGGSCGYNFWSIACLYST